MSRCPFWSSENLNEECYEECPMKQELNKSEECIFQEFLDVEELEFKDKGKLGKQVPLLNI